MRSLAVLFMLVALGSCSGARSSTPAAAGGAVGPPFYLTAPFLDAAAADVGYDPVTLAGRYRYTRRTYLADHRAHPIARAEHVMQVASEGHGGEGHAVVTLFRIDEQGMHVDASAGLFSDSRQGGFATSFAIERSFTESSWCLFEPCEVEVTPAAAAVAARRDGWRGWFGPLPAALAARILEDPAQASYVRLDPDAYAMRLEELRRLHAGPATELTPAYVRGAFQRDWRALANLACFDLYPVLCRGIGEGGALWPQRQFAEMFAGDHRRQELFEMAHLRALGAPATPAPLHVGAAGRRAFVCLDDSEARWSPIGAPLRVVAYDGELQDGRPHGEGTVFLGGGCASARTAPREQRRLRGRFVAGFPDGPAEVFNSLGHLVVAGRLRAGLLDGSARIFGDFGSERSTAEYAGGLLAAGPFRYADLDFFFLKVAPPPARRIFAGTLEGGRLAGAWQPVAMAVGAPGRQMVVVDGQMYLDWDPTPGAHATGPVVRDHERMEYRFRGPGELRWANGNILRGRWNADGSLLTGDARFYDASKGKWYPTTVDANGKFTYTVVKRVRRPWYDNIGPELTRWRDTAMDQLNRAGHGIDHFVCNALGKKEGENCHLNGGAQAGPDGTVLTDGSGTPSEVPWQSAGVDWSAALDWQRTTELNDYERQLDAVMMSPFFTAHGPTTLSRAPADLASSLTPAVFLRGAPTATGLERVHDPGGDGRFGARRAEDVTLPDGTVVKKYRVHNGTDYLAAPGDAVVAPFDGVVTFVRNDDVDVRRNFIQITSPTGVRAELTYVKPLAGPGAIVATSRVTRGSLIGFAADLSKAYPRAQNHVHIQYWEPGPRGSKGYWVSPDGRTRIERAP